MRTGKKLLALLLALSMALSLTVTAFAEDESAAGSEAAPAEETTETAGEETGGGVTILYTNDVHTYIDNTYEVDETQSLPVIRYSTVAGLPGLPGERAAGGRRRRHQAPPTAGWTTARPSSS